MQEFKKTPIDQVSITERISRITSRSIKKEAKMSLLELAINVTDLTTLEGKDTPKKVQQLCYKAAHVSTTYDVPNVAAICVYPSMVSVAKEALQNTGIKVAAVSTYFPSGQHDKDLKLEDVKRAVKAGADEIDMVISRGKFLSGDYTYVFNEIKEVKAACGSARLKVILETGELGDLENVRLASDIAIAAGADFIKTSTGKIGVAATLPVTLVMLEAIRDHYLKTGKMVGMKPAGGISNAKTAIQYLVLVNEILGTKWLNNTYFRFGASSLVNQVMLQVAKQKTGRYQSLDYFSKD